LVCRVLRGIRRRRGSSRSGGHGPRSCRTIRLRAAQKGNTMKRMLAVLLALSLLFAGCGGKTDNSDKNMISGVGSLEFSTQEETESQDGEFPSADEVEVQGQQELNSGASRSAAALSQASHAAQGSSQASSRAPASSAASSSAAAASQQASSSAASSSSSAQNTAGGGSAVKGEISAVWLSYLDLGPMLTGKTKAQFQTAINKAFSNIAGTGFNTVIVQVRPFGDALYSSDYFPWSYVCTGTEGEDPGFDPLQIMVAAAHSKGLSIEAWLNPYRVRAANYTKPLSDDNQAVKWLDEGSDAAVEYNGGIYYNPGSKQARQLIINGVREIVQKYSVDGIHFDDYFYPNPNSSFDADTYADYSGSLSLGDWRRENVNTLVKALYSTIKSCRSSVRFGISPSGNNSNNYNQQYADVAKWVKTSGYVDYICPQIYWGFDHSTMPFAATVDSWNSMVTSPSVRLVVGIGAYRLGESGEWSGTTDILARMVKKARTASRCGGVALYRYDSLYNSAVASQAAQECASLSKVL